MSEVNAIADKINFITPVVPRDYLFEVPCKERRSGIGPLCIGDVHQTLESG